MNDGGPAFPTVWLDRSEGREGYGMTLRDYLAAAILHGELPREFKVAAALHGRVEVFSLGEILIVDQDGREIGGNMRKPEKWFVDAEYFDTAEQAVSKASEVIEKRSSNET